MKKEQAALQPISRGSPVKYTENMARDQGAIKTSTRRNFLAGAASAIAATAASSSNALAAPLEVQPSSKALGRPTVERGYGMPSKYEAHVTRNRTDIFVNKQNFSDWSMTPIQHQQGIVTPNGLIFERHHAGIPDIDPDKHELVIHGMVKQPMKYSMDNLMRYPSVSKFHFMECSGNGLTDWLAVKSKTVQQTHGLLSCSQWTGIPVSWLLDEVGLQSGAKWLLFEGADGSAHARSIPIDKALDDALLVFASGGENLRPENGYPLRAFMPGWEGNTSVKWLRRIKVSDKPWHLRSETARYTDPMPEGKWRQFSMEMECKSVITNPSGGMQLQGPGFYEIQGFAWSGRGTVTSVDITTDGGSTWRTADLEGPVMDKCLTRFDTVGIGMGGQLKLPVEQWIALAMFNQPSQTSHQSVRSSVSFNITTASFHGLSAVAGRCQMLLHKIGFTAGLVLAMSIGVVIADSSKPAVSFGTVVSETDIAAWNIDIETPTGRGLPPGSGSVAQGKALYDVQCVACHGTDAEGGSQYGSMVGGIGSFVTEKRRLTPASMYPYAPILFDYIRRAMPMTAPQSLSDDEVYALTAYIYALNGLLDKDAVLDATTLASLDMPNKDGFMVDDRPDAAATRCMVDCK